MDELFQGMFLINTLKKLQPPSNLLLTDLSARVNGSSYSRRGNVRASVWAAGLLGEFSFINKYRICGIKARLI